MSPISRRLAAALLAASVSVLVPGAGCANKSPSSHSGASASTGASSLSSRWGKIESFGVDCGSADASFAAITTK